LNKSSSLVALITGASRGIGLETGRKLAKRGVHVVLGVRDEAKGRELLATLQAEGINVDMITLDVVVASDRKKAFEYFETRYGKLDILVNNAGVWLDPVDLSQYAFSSVESVTEEILRATFNVNFFASVLLTQLMLPLLKKAPAGRIVNVSSILGSHGAQANPKSQIYGMKAFAYDASKAALNTLTTHLAAALAGTSIKVNSVHPGWVKTELGGPNAMADVAEGSESSVQYALLPADGPNGGFFNLNDRVPW
jgi:NAD(P)-dependent dehydrogenase (short-subunit alcohol dehydrogenase family)